MAECLVFVFLTMANGRDSSTAASACSSQRHSLGDDRAVRIPVPRAHEHASTRAREHASTRAREHARIYVKMPPRSRGGKVQRCLEHEIALSAGRFQNFRIPGTRTEEMSKFPIIPGSFPNSESRDSDSPTALGCPISRLPSRVSLLLRGIGTPLQTRSRGAVQRATWRPARCAHPTSASHAPPG